MKSAQYLHTIIDNVQPIPSSPDQFYAELTSRNKHFIDPIAQKKIRDLKIVVAGCGAGGGACIEPLVRLGVTHLRISDVGLYELANLNRQHTFIDCIGMNKATFHEREIKRINPYTDVIAYTEGVNEKNLPEMIEWADMIFDCVDVTTYSAITAKLFMHEVAKEKRKPVFSMLDLGFCQWGVGFDYRKSGVKVLDGRLKRARAHKNPIKILLEMFPLSAFPAHSLPLAIDLLNNPTDPASQLGCAADLLSAVAATAVVRYAKEETFLKGWNINLEGFALPLKERMAFKLKAPWMRFKIRRLLEAKSAI